MSEWMAIADWGRCHEVERPGIIFEIRNDEGLSLFTPCVPALPQVPFDWKLPATKFRAVAETGPVHSTPLPPPVSGK